MWVGVSCGCVGGCELCVCVSCGCVGGCELCVCVSCVSELSGCGWV